MFPWMMPNASMGSNLSLLSMMQPGGMQGGYGNMMEPGYWDRVNAARAPGQSNWDTFMRGMLPQSMWPEQWREQGDRSDQTRRGNQPDRGNTMAPDGQRGGPDNNAMSPYDPNTVAPASAGAGSGWSPSTWMQAMNAGMQRSALANPRTALQMGMLGARMMQPRINPYPF